MTRTLRVDLCCPDCRAALKIDERLSARASGLVYVCKECGRLWSTGPADTNLVEERTMLDAVSRTQKIPAVKAPGRGSAESLPEGISVALEVTDGPGRGQVYHLDRRMVVIGREEGEVRIVDPMISRRHASLEVLDLDTIILRDLSSTNGTYHNDQLIAFCKIQDGDEIRLGSTTFTVSVDALG